MLNAKAILVAASAAILINSASAGVLGERAVTTTFDYVVFDNDFTDDGLGLTVGYRQAVATGIDLELGYSYLDSGVKNGPSVHAHSLNVGSTFYVTKQDTKPFVAVGFSWVDAHALGSGDNDWYYNVAAGIELKASSNVTVSPYVAWADGFNGGDEGTGSVGLNIDYAIDTAWSTVIDGSISDDGDFGFSLGVRVKF